MDGLDHVDIRSGDDTRQPQAPGWKILTAIVREHPRRLSSDLDSRLWGEETGYKPAADILAIMRVLKRRDPTLDRVIIDLTHADPAEVDLSNAKLSDASLSGASFAVGLTVQDSHAGDLGLCSMSFPPSRSSPTRRLRGCAKKPRSRTAG